MKQRKLRLRTVCIPLILSGCSLAPSKSRLPLTFQKLGDHFKLFDPVQTKRRTVNQIGKKLELKVTRDGRIISSISSALRNGRNNSTSTRVHAIA